MKYMTKLFSLCTLWFFLALTNQALAVEPTIEEERKGPHGGVWLEGKEIDLEITIFETGVPPEMRVFAYQAGVLINPAKLDLEVMLDRLGGDRDTLSFVSEKDYLVSEQVVTEPHSFDVTIKVDLGEVRENWNYENHEGRTEISQRLVALSNIGTEVAGPQTLKMKETLFGVIKVPQNQRYQIQAPYTSIVERVHVIQGEKVKKGQVLLSLKNSKTLQLYTLKSPAKGQVSELMVNTGQLSQGEVLLTIIDLSKVWVEMSAFPEAIEKLALGQAVTVSNMHHGDTAEGQVSYIAGIMTGGHIARVRTVIANSAGHWRPGMHVIAEITVAEKRVELAVRREALQSFRDMSVVFARFGDQFEVRMVELGEEDSDYVEVVGGLKQGTKYVSRNSFLIKADVLKDGASHDH